MKTLYLVSVIAIVGFALCVGVLIVKEYQTKNVIVIVVRRRNDRGRI